MRILIADDDKNIRVFLSLLLKKWGYEVVAVSDGARAWEVIQKERIRFVISDWMMPGMNGEELCRKIRAAKLPDYTYLILLTAKDEKEKLVEGMAAGADDFLVKPFDKEELRARIKAGERIVQLEHDLETKNRELTESNESLRKAHATISKDIEAAAKIQRSLLPEPSFNKMHGLNFGWLFYPSSFVSGDIFNFFEFNKRYTVFYLIDVAGHGIPAAMLSVALSKVLSPPVSQSAAPLRHFMNSETPHYKIVAPAMAVRELNKRFLNGGDTMHYFTMVYGIVDKRDGKVKITQAGHPYPIYMPKKGSPYLIKKGGIPVGMLPEVQYEEEEFFLRKGDRLFIYSDGITECMNSNSEMFSESRLVKFVKKWQDLPLIDILAKLKQTLQTWRGKSEFDDDISLLAIEMSE